MSKYEPLGNFLKNLTINIYKFRFEDIENITGEKLPPSAYQYDAWWSNNESHPLMNEVLKAGWKKSNIDFKNKQVEFSRNITSQDFISSEQLENYLQEKMEMKENYQPVVIKTLIENGGRTSKELIRQVLENYNQPSPTQSMFYTVLGVLKRHNIIREKDDKLILNTNGSLSDGESKKIINLCNQKIAEANELRKSSGSNVWIWSVAADSWKIVKEKKIWASKIRENIRTRVRPGDKVIFYVSGTGQFQGIYEFDGDWYDATEPVWSDETNSVIYPSQIRLKPVKMGNVDVYDIASKLKLFPNPEDKRIVNLVLKGGAGYPSNNGKPISHEDYLTIFNSMVGNPSDILEYYIALGPWSNWDHTIKHPPLRWGVRDSSASNIGVYDALREGDIVFYYANQDLPTPFSKRGLFGVGRVTRKYIENDEKYWPDEQISNKVIYKHRFEIENLKLVMTDEELLPWIDGLPFTKGLNHIVDQVPLEKLLEHARVKWKLDLPTLSKTNSVNHWKISPGEQAKYWQDDLDKGIIAIGWSKLGDLSGITPEELNKRMREQYFEEVAQRYQIENFLKIKKGDIIIANRGKSTVVGIGRVVGDYKYYAALEQPHTYQVEWFDTKERQIPTQNNWFVTVLPVSSDFYEQILSGDFTSEGTYLLLRHKDSEENKWRDELGKKYHFGKIANYTKLNKGSKAAWFDKKDGKYYFWGYGDVDEIIPDENENFHAIFNDFQSFNPPKESTDSIREKIERSPGYNIQSSILEINKDLYDEIVGNRIPFVSSDDPLPIPTKSELEVGYKKISEELLVPEEKITEIVTALASGRHVLLAGPIGTGKTELARKIPTIFWEKYGGYYSEDHTATADWNTQDVIGGIFPKMNKGGQPIYEIQNGCVVDTVQKNWLNGVNGGPRNHSQSPSKIPPYRGTWLIIDEFNRADIDKAFGQLFTALRTHTLKIPTDVEKISYKTLKIPQDYRIIGTLNTADKHYLFQLSDALKSRFAYIEIDIPKKEQFEQEIYYAMKNALSDLVTNHYENLVVLNDQAKKINKEQTTSEFYSRIYQAYHFLDSVRIFKRLGTAILKLVYQNLLVGTKMTGNSKVALDNALTSNLIPQLENLSQAEIGAIHALYSDSIVKYFQDAYRNPNRQSYVDSLTSVLEYLQVPNTTLVAQFANGNLNVEDTAIWRPLQTAYDIKKQEFELQLDQLKQSMEDLIETMVI